jgi:hypothetical protein
MLLDQFGTNYGLGPETLKKFEQNYYTNAHVLQFVTINELNEMDFCLGKIAGLRDAVEQWSFARVE